MKLSLILQWFTCIGPHEAKRSMAEETRLQERTIGGAPPSASYQGDERRAD